MYIVHIDIFFKRGISKSRLNSFCKPAQTLLIKNIRDDLLSYLPSIIGNDSVLITYQL